MFGAVTKQSLAGGFGIAARNVNGTAFEIVSGYIKRSYRETQMLDGASVLRRGKFHLALQTIPLFAQAISRRFRRLHASR
jgi:hypothetical protein